MLLLFDSIGNGATHDVAAVAHLQGRGVLDAKETPRSKRAISVNQMVISGYQFSFLCIQTNCTCLSASIRILS